jgi:hypothetical protein
MVKLILGFLLGCFVTYNYIIGDPTLEPVLEKTNIWVLETINSIQAKLESNVNK